MARGTHQPARMTSLHGSADCCARDSQAAEGQGDTKDQGSPVRSPRPFPGEPDLRGGEIAEDSRVHGGILSRKPRVAPTGCWLLRPRLAGPFRGELGCRCRISRTLSYKADCPEGGGISLFRSLVRGGKRAARALLARIGSDVPVAALLTACQIRGPAGWASGQRRLLAFPCAGPAPFISCDGAPGTPSETRDCPVGCTHLWC